MTYAIAPLDRSSVLDDPRLRGGALCRAYSGLMDDWLATLFDATVADPSGIAMVAVGGYGRAELSPSSDIDLVLVHRGRKDIAEIAQQVWYPIWDESLKLGHAVRTIKEALSLANEDLDTATSLLSGRCVAGDQALADELAKKSLELWQKRGPRWLGELSASVKQRHARVGEVSFLLEPDLKDGRGGLRDAHAIVWAEDAESVMLPDDAATIGAAYETVLSARVELHRRTGRPGDVLVLEEQDAVASALGYEHADDFMRDLSAAARTISWTSDEVWDRVDSALAGPPRRRGRTKPETLPGVVIRDNGVALSEGIDPADDPLTALRVAVVAAENDLRIERTTLNRLGERSPELDDPWPEGARELFVDLLLAGHPAIQVIEALDLKGVWVRILPEWSAVRFKPQRNAYHTFTVDRHLCEVAANASEEVSRVDRPDLLVVGALLHDIGKGYPGDHTDVGIHVIANIGPRMGFLPEDVALLQAMVRHHLLLPDIAIRRDLSDDGTIESVAQAVGSLTTLRLLEALTIADSLGTGPAAWGSWKASLVEQLVESTAHVLGGGEVSEVTTSVFPTARHLELMGQNRRIVEALDDEVVVISPDWPGMFSRVAGALALNGLAVVASNAYSDETQSMAVESFRVVNRFGSAIPWTKVIDDIELALDGRLAIAARLTERAKVYTRKKAITSIEPAPPRVVFDNDLSNVFTVIEVTAPDAVGVLYRMTHAISELDIDIRSVKAQTLSAEVVDSFYVLDRAGNKITPDFMGEIEKAILHALAT